MGVSKLTLYREKLNLTQEALSLKSGISIRTIQRIESGQNPKGHTLKALAKALDIPEKDLLNSTDKIDDININLTNLINLSSIFVVYIPILNFLVPYVFALHKKQMNRLSKQIISIQIIWSMMYILVFFIGNMIDLEDFGRDLFLILLLFMVFTNVFITLRNSIAIVRDHNLYFKFSFSFL